MFEQFFGNPVPIDVDGDGIIDGVMIQGAQDMDGDGNPDVFFSELHIDTDGDGIEDVIQTQVFADTDFDGQLDYNSLTTMSDLDGDGQVDYVMTQEDFDGDGMFDTVTTAQDYNGDGVFDTVTIAEDYDGDGQFDAVTTAEDYDGDGVFDHVVTAEDTTGDGNFDRVNEFMDMDGDGVLDAISPYAPVNDGDAPAYETYDPSESDPDAVVGDPAEAMESWHWQETGTSCAVASQEFVLEQLTGQDFDEGDLRELAQEYGWYDPNGGTPMDDVGNILIYMGLNVQQSQDNTIDDIKECLENGGQVIVGVDSGELWSGENEELFGPGMDADHAVQVIGVDYSDASQPMIILNDPGAANGGGAMVPADDFMDAWEDSGCFMVEAYA